MRTCTHARRLSGVLALLVALIGLTPLYAQSAPSEETVRTVRRMLERLPCYGVFDFLAFSVDRGTVTLVGYSYQGNPKADAEMAGDTGKRSQRSGDR
jgi:hypothetical protein